MDERSTIELHFTRKILIAVGMTITIVLRLLPAVSVGSPMEKICVN